MIVVIPSTIQIFAWLHHRRRPARPRFTTPLLFIGGFIVFFVLGGLTGIMFAAIPFDQAATDTYFVVAHFHFIIFGAAVFPLLGGSTTGSRRSPAGCTTSGWARRLLADVRRDGADVLPDAHRRAARDAAARLHLPRRARLGRPTTCSRRSARSCSPAGLLLIAREPRREPRPRRAGRARPVRRRHARVDDDLAAAARTTSRSSRR